MRRVSTKSVSPSTASSWTKSESAYLDQPAIVDRCYAQKGRKFTLGSAIYKYSSCDHFRCGERMSKECIATHKSKTGKGDQSEAGTLANEADDKQESGGEEGQIRADIEETEGPTHSEDDKDSDSNESANREGNTLSKKKNKNLEVKFEVENSNNLLSDNLTFKNEDHRSVIRVVQGEAKVMSYEDLEEARAKRAAKEKATIGKVKGKRVRKRKFLQRCV